MFRRLIPLFCFSMLVFGAGTVFAQVQTRSQLPSPGESGSLWVTASAGQEQVRFATLGMAQRMRLEVLDQFGERVYDSDFQDGNLLDWKFEDGQGHRMPDGLYGCLITAEDISGQWIRRRGVFSLKDGRIQFGDAGGSLEMSGDPAGVPASITVLHDDAGFAATYLAHDGKAGRIVSGRGGLSFRSGDLFAGSDIEHMRLTADGKLGIGVEEPAAKLDVAGMIHTTEGIMFPDGTIQRTAAGSLVVGGFSRSSAVLGLGGNSVSPGQDGFPGGGIAGNQRLGAGGFSLNALRKPGLPPLALTPGDQSFTGRLCFGSDCLDPETWSGTAGENVRLKQNNNRFTFIDTSAGGFPQGDWQIRANSNAASGADFFAIDWLGTSAATATDTPVSTPFRIDGAAPSNALYINSSGSVGIGIGSPLAPLHLGGNVGKMRLGSNSVSYSEISHDASTDDSLSIGNRSPAGSLNLQTGGSNTRITISSAGNVGIGTTNPVNRFMVSSASRGMEMAPNDGPTHATILGSYDRVANVYLPFDFAGSTVQFTAGGAPRMFITEGGNVGIGTTTPGVKLHVMGSIQATAFNTGAPEMDLPDYVFDPEYRLMPIEELQKYVERERHLPNVPPAAEIKEKGLNLGEFQIKLLEKIEELTLYTMQQAKANDRKDAEISALKSQNSILDARIAALEQMMERLAKQGEQK